MLFQFSLLSQELIVSETGRKSQVSITFVYCKLFMNSNCDSFVCLEIYFFSLKKNHKGASSGDLNMAHKDITLKLDNLCGTRRNTEVENEKLKLKVKCHLTQFSQQNNSDLSNHNNFNGILQPTKKDWGMHVYILSHPGSRESILGNRR